MIRHPKKARLSVALAVPMLALAAGACSSADIDATNRWVDQQWTSGDHIYPPAQLAIGARRAEVSGSVMFAPRSAVLTYEQRDALGRFLARHGAGRGDDATISLSPAPGRALADRRVAAIASVLHRNGLRVTRSFGPSPAPDLATITVSRIVAYGPNCPEWDRLLKHNVVEEYQPRLGCMNAASLAASVHRPQDLESGRPLGNSDAQVLDRGLSNLREGKLDAKPEPEGTGTKSSGTAAR